jgi:hypothetical protein
MCLAAHYPKNDQPTRRGRAIYLLYSNGQRLSLYPVEVMDWYKGIELAPVERTGDTRFCVEDLEEAIIRTEPMLWIFPNNEIHAR